MLSLDALRDVRRIVVHAYEDVACPDGRASAVILRAALPHAEIVEMAYDSRAHRELAPRPGVLFCDFSPWAPPLPENPTAFDREVRRAALLRWADEGAIILDHHGDDLVTPFGERGVHGANAQRESGAVLAWREVLCALRQSAMRDDFATLAELAAIRDTWQRADPRFEEASTLAMALTFPALDVLLQMSLSAVFVLADHVGPILRRNKLDAAREAAAAGRRVTTRDGRRVALIPSAGLTSDVADVLGDDVDFVAGFQHVHEAGYPPRLRWSLRSRAGVDVRAIARRHGGNGHVAAAGFRVADDGRSPYVRAPELLAAPEEG